MHRCHHRLSVPLAMVLLLAAPGPRASAAQPPPVTPPEIAALVEAEPALASLLASGVVVSDVSAGGYHTCALTSLGAVKCWGDNRWGQLGDGTTTNSLAAVNVAGLFRGVTAISAGDVHTCALTAAGGVMCWGDNNYGQLGDGTLIDRHTPVYALGLPSGVAAIGVGDVHTCALTTSSGVKCWGYGFNGELGNGSEWFLRAPGPVAGLDWGVAAIGVGQHHNCAATTVGELRCWGLNTSGQLGDGTTTTRLVPVTVAGVSDVTLVSANLFHTCAHSSSGVTSCWGRNFQGQLGDGTTMDRLTPVAVVGLDQSLTTIDTGNRHTCALTADGGVKCWGGNDYGALGDGSNTRAQYTPVDAVGLTSGAAALSTGTWHTCAVTTSGELRCFGYNGEGQIGDGTITERRIPVTVTIEDTDRWLFVPLVPRQSMSNS